MGRGVLYGKENYLRLPRRVASSRSPAGRARVGSGTNVRISVGLPVGDSAMLTFQPLSSVAVVANTSGLRRRKMYLPAPEPSAPYWASRKSTKEDPLVKGTETSLAVVSVS